MDDVRLPFHDRRQAGRVLGERLQFRGTDGDCVVLALPRGGVAVGYEVAHALGAPLDIFVVRKLGFPGHPEYAMGAIASGGVRVMNPIEHFEVSQQAIARVIAQETAELQRRELLYRGSRPAIALRGREVIVVDDGLATGATMRAAVQAIRQQQPLHVTVAVPVGSDDACELLQLDADEVICAAVPRPFHAVGTWYRDFPQTSDDEVRSLLEDARREHAAAH